MSPIDNRGICFLIFSMSFFSGQLLVKVSKVSLIGYRIMSLICLYFVSEDQSSVSRTKSELNQPAVECHTKRMVVCIVNI